MTTTTSAHPADDAGPGRPGAGGLSRWQKAIGVLGLIVVLWVGDRLSTVIDRGGTGPGMDHGPGGGTPTTQPTGDDRPVPGGEEPSPGRHDPSQFDHG